MSLFLFVEKIAADQRESFLLSFSLQIYASHDGKNIVTFDQNHNITIPIHILVIINVTEWLIIDSKRQI